MNKNATRAANGQAPESISAQNFADIFDWRSTISFMWIFHVADKDFFLGEALFFIWQAKYPFEIKAFHVVMC